MGTTVIDELEKLKTLLSEARKVPFSKYVTIDREDFLMSINKIEMILPEEVKEAFLVQKKTEEILKQSSFEGQEIIDKAKEKEKELLADSHIIKEAEVERQKIIKTAQDEANMIREDADEYVLKLLDRVETVVDKTKLLISEGKDALKNENPNEENP